MKKRRLESEWTEYASVAELLPRYRLLAERAIEATQHSYSPYSRFQVGAAALMADESIVMGANMENASFPLSMCAEKSCIAQTESLFPGLPVQVIAVTARQSGHTIQRPITPCGSCRQVLVEKEQRQGHELEILLFGETGPVWHFAEAKDLLPLPFVGDHLRE